MSLTPREERGLRIASQQGHVVPRQRDLKDWNVRSESRNLVYIVSLDPPDSPRCTCPDFELRQRSCKHIIAVEYALGRRTVPEETTPVRRTYSQDWPAYNEAQTHEKPLFIRLLHDLCDTVVEPQQSRGRPRLPLADMVLASAYKVYVGFSSRRFVGELREACDRRVIEKVPHFNSVSNYLSDPGLTAVFSDLVTLSSLPLRHVEVDFAVDSSGFSTCRFVRWFNRKYGREVDNREWVKAHLVCGVKTKIVTGVDISGWYANDSPYFVPLVQRAARNFRIGRVLADKAYSSRRNLEAVDKVGGVPFIPFKSNTVQPQGYSIWDRMLHVFMSHRELFLESYHLRSNVESGFSMIKGKFGDAVRSKSYEAQVNEVLCKVICHNLCVIIHAMYKLGIRPDYLAELRRAEAVIGEGLL